MADFIDLVLLAMLALTALRIIFLKDLFAVVMLFGIYSFLSALIFINLDAVDVAFTEASVGAGISTVLMLGTLALKRERQLTLFTTSAICCSRHWCCVNLWHA